MFSVQFMATDLFELNGKHYLLTVDRFTRYPILDYMPHPVSSQAVTQKIKMYCALFGRAEEIMSDNGP